MFSFTFLCKFSWICNFCFFVWIFMKISPKCRTKKLGMRNTILGSFRSCLNWEGADIQPKSGLGISLIIIFLCQSIFQDPSLDLLRRFSIGLCSGILGSVINIPFDVAKSRIQGPQPVPGQIKYRTCFATMVTVYKEEGYVNYSLS